jgi:hypothetical protein
MASIINASTSGAGGVITTADASGQLELQTAGVTRQTIDVNGNVGIGTTSPSTLGLTVYKASGSSGCRYSSGTNNFEISINGVDAYVANGANGPLQFWTNGSERMRIDSDGVVYQNCTGVTGDAPNNAGGVLTQPNGNTKVRAQSNGQAAFQFYSPGGGTGSPVGSVAINASSTSYNTSSDYRLKQDVEPMTGALNMVAQLKPVTYTWKNTGEAGQGFIAHELQAVVPDCVTGEKDAVDAEGNPVYQGIDTSFLVATLTAAIQEQQAIITDLKARIEVLEGASA